MTERQGVEIDYCPKCRGVWLDRGELDKIIDRATEQAPAPIAAPPPPQPASPQPHPAPAPGTYQQPWAGQQPYPQSRPYGKDDSDYKFRYPSDQGHGHYPRKKRGFLGELFDFD